MVYVGTVFGYAELVASNARSDSAFAGMCPGVTADVERAGKARSMTLGLASPSGA
jgi:hypothetical protein